MFGSSSTTSTRGLSIGPHHVRPAACVTPPYGTRAVRGRSTPSSWWGPAWATGSPWPAPSWGRSRRRALCLFPGPTVPAMTTKSLPDRFVVEDFCPFLRTRVFLAVVHCHTVPSRLRMVSVVPLLEVSCPTLPGDLDEALLGADRGLAVHAALYQAPDLGALALLPGLLAGLLVGRRLSGDLARHLLRRRREVGAATRGGRAREVDPGADDADRERGRATDDQFLHLRFLLRLTLLTQADRFVEADGGVWEFDGSRCFSTRTARTRSVDRLSRARSRCRDPDVVDISE